MVDNPSSLIDGMLDRTREIVWWNRNLTMLTNETYFENGKEFLTKDLIPIKGPFIEHIKRPASGESTLHELQEELHLNDALVKSIKSNVFRKLKDPDEARLYAHQEAALRTVLGNEEDDILITAPTSGGKTESFLFPILQYCLDHIDECGLKAIFIYPMKTLATDQLNRLLKYVWEVNKESNKKLYVSIWDADTPEGVTSADAPRQGYQCYDTPHQRGLQCPRCKSDLNLTSEESLYCPRCSFAAPWARTTRRSIREAAKSGNIDILITNPEALETMLVDPRLQCLLGNALGNPPLKYVVFDEAHIWRGAPGSSISLFAKRLKELYCKKNLQFILASATIENGEEFAKSLLGDRDAQVVSVPFHVEIAKVPPMKFSFGRITPTNFDEIVQVAYLVATKIESRLDLETGFPQLIGALKTATYLNIIREDPDGKLTGTDIVREIMETVRPSGLDDILDEIGILTKELLDSPNFVESWRDHLLQNCPEINAISQFMSSGDGPVTYAPESDLIDLVTSNWGPYDPPDRELARTVLATCLNLGRTAQLLSDKYHVFIGPTSHVYYCSKCRWLSLQERCPKCDSASEELAFCKDCNAPLMVSRVVSSESSDEEDEEDADNSKDKQVYREVIPIRACKHRAAKPSVWYPSFVTYMLSYLCRESSSKKVLVFSDSRRTANTITKTLQDLDHTLVAEQLFVRELLNSKDQTARLGDIRAPLLQQLKRYYEDFLRESESTPELKDFIRRYDTQVVFSKSFLNNLRHLFGGAIIAPRVVIDLARGNEDLAVGFLLFEALYSDFEVKFSDKKVPFSGTTPDRLVQKVQRRIPRWSEAKVRDVVYHWITRFLHSQLLVSHTREELEAKIDNTSIPDSAKGQLKAYFTEQRKIITNIDPASLDKDGTGWLNRLDKDMLENIQFTLVPSVVVCPQCTTTLPTQDGAYNCPRCGAHTELVTRLKDGGVASDGVYLEQPWDLDHWAREILGVASRYQDQKVDIPHIFPGVHTSQARQDIRGLLEKGFKSDPPRVNVISATPTLELGVDIGNLDTIIQVGIPPTLTNYVQRSGRAGRVRGRPSFIFTVLRNEHAIDEYHYENIEEYLARLRPIKIPDPEDLDNIVASQMMGETLSYISRYVDSNVYAQVSSVPMEFEQAIDIARMAKKCASNIRYIASNENDPESLAKPLREHLNNIFGRDDIYTSLFTDASSSLNLVSTASTFFDRLRDLSNESMSRYRDTTEWLSELALFRSYRGAGHDIPIVTPASGTNAKMLLMMQEAGRVLSENFPGPRNNGLGARFDYEGVSYRVDKVNTSIPLGYVNLCPNDECELYLRAFPARTSTSSCPHCHTELVRRAVMRPEQVIVEDRRSFGETYATVSSLPTMENSGEWLKRDDLTLPYSIAYGDVRVLSVTPAFYTSGRSKETRYDPSEVPVSVSAITEEESPFAAARSTGPRVEYGHIGNSLDTLGFCLKFRKEDMVTIYEERLYAGFTSLVQALRLGASITGESELDDLDAAWLMDENEVTFFVYDTKPRGSGIAKQVYLSIISDSTAFLQSLRQIADCRYCTSFCSHCLLLPRTSPKYIKDNLLDRKLVQRILP